LYFFFTANKAVLFGQRAIIQKGEGCQGVMLQEKIRARRFFIELHSHNYFEQEIKNPVFFAQLT